VTLADFPRAIVEDAKQLGYHERKERSICTRPGCNADPADDSNECPPHRDDSRTRKARSKRRKRSKWRRLKRCMTCGRKRLRGRKHCAKCTARLGYTKAARGDKSVDNERDRQFTNAMETDGWTRSRYRGQGKRGRQSTVQIDDQDLRYAIDAIQKAKNRLMFVSDAEMPRSERQDAIRAALAQAAHGVRFVEEVLDRHRYGSEIQKPAAKRRG
jgi:hypothetical protein